MTRRLVPLVALALLAACSREGEIASTGVYTTRSTCPQAAIPAGLGDITLFNPADSTSASAIDVEAAITNLRATCTSDAASIVSSSSFDVVASRRDVSAARQVVLPYFNVVMQGGDTVVAKRVGQVVLDFPAGAARAQARVTGTVRVAKSAVTLPAEVQRELTRERKPGDADAAVDPLADPAVRAAVTRASFEHLVGFQLTPAQLRYNATR